MSTAREKPETSRRRVRCPVGGPLGRRLKTINTGISMDDLADHVEVDDVEELDRNVSDLASSARDYIARYLREQSREPGQRKVSMMLPDGRRPSRLPLSTSQARKCSRVAGEGSRTAGEGWGEGWGEGQGSATGSRRSCKLDDDLSTARDRPASMRRRPPGRNLVSINTGISMDDVPIEAEVDDVEELDRNVNDLASSAQDYIAQYLRQDSRKKHNVSPQKFENQRADNFSCRRGRRSHLQVDDDFHGSKCRPESCKEHMSSSEHARSMRRIQTEWKSGRLDTEHRRPSRCLNEVHSGRSGFVMPGAAHLPAPGGFDDAALPHSPAALPGAAHLPAPWDNAPGITNPGIRPSECDPARRPSTLPPPACAVVGQMTVPRPVLGKPAAGAAVKTGRSRGAKISI